jgi:hypothetical protein
MATSDGGAEREFAPVGWDYRVARDADTGGLLLIEAYFDTHGQIIGWCEAALHGDDVAALVRNVKNAALLGVVEPEQLRLAEHRASDDPGRRPLVSFEGREEREGFVESIWRRPLSDEETALARGAVAVFEAFMVFIRARGRFQPRWSDVDAHAALMILDDIVQDAADHWRLPAIHRHPDIARLRDWLEHSTTKSPDAATSA